MNSKYIINELRPLIEEFGPDYLSSIIFLLREKRIITYHPENDIALITFKSKPHFRKINVDDVNNAIVSWKYSNPELSFPEDCDDWFAISTNDIMNLSSNIEKGNRMLNLKAFL